MKRFNSIIAIIGLAIVATAVAFVSCKKEKQEQKSYNVEQSTQCFDNMDEYLLSFKEKLLSAEKGNELISLDQAQRDLGNLLNYDFGDANYISNVFQRDMFHLKLSTNNGMVDMAELSTVYKKAFANIKDLYSKVDLPEKSIYFIACKLFQESKDDEADIQFVITTRGTQPEPLKISYDETDNWRVHALRGKCDGTCVGNDHLTMLKKVYYNTRETIGCVNGRLYYTDNGYCDFNGVGFPEESPSAPYYNMGFRLWCGTASNIYTYCVGYEEMYYYLNNLRDILDNWMFLDTDQTVISIELSIEPYYSSYYGNLLTTRCDFEYATVNCTDDPISD